MWGCHPPATSVAMGQAAAVVHPRLALLLRVLAKAVEVMQAIGMVCSEHASHRKRAHLSVVANHGARLADGVQRPASAAKTLTKFGGDRSIVDLEDGGTAPTGAQHHAGPSRVPSFLTEVSSSSVSRTRMAPNCDGRGAGRSTAAATREPFSSARP